MRNRWETRAIDIALLPVKAVLWILVLVFGPAPKVRIIEDEDKLGYYVDTCPNGCCPHGGKDVATLDSCPLCCHCGSKSTG